MSLSDNINKYERYGDVCEVNTELIIKDVKDFIKELKEDINIGIKVLNKIDGSSLILNNVIKKIDKLAGDDLK